MTDPIRVLIVEDAPDLRQEIAYSLQLRGIETAGAANLAEMRAHLTASTWHILLLDFDLPEANGVMLARQVREDYGQDLWIILTTALGQREERICGRQAGVDTCLIKPIDGRELMAVIEQLTRRLTLSAGTRPPRPVNSGEWQLDAAKKELHCPHQGLVTLTGAETLVLEALLQARGRIVSRGILARKLPGQFNGREIRRLDSVLSRLRIKVKRETGVPLPITTFRNIGFAFPDATSGHHQAL